eukprot:1921986-Amphidinium_carterae.1
MEFRLALVSQGYLGQKSYEEAKNTNALDVAVSYQAQRDQLIINKWPAGVPLCYDKMLTNSGTFGAGRLSMP